MKVNGNEINLDGKVLLKDFLTEKGYDVLKIAVERNGEIVPKRSYGEVLLEEEDCLEVVSFVGGG